MPDLHRLADHVVGTLLRTGRLYSRGFGGFSRLDDLVRQVRDYPGDEPPAPLDVRWTRDSRREPRTLRGELRSPAAAILPPESARAVIELVLPPGRSPSDRPPVCLMLAATGEEGFGGRRRFAAPLVRRGIGVLFLENPYYGARRPRGQIGPALATVADQFAMNLATVIEARALLAWLHERGHRRVGVTGYSQGGIMAAFAGVLVGFPVALVPRGAGRSTIPIFTDSALSRAFHWRKLAEEMGSLEEARRYFARCLEPVDVGLHPPPFEPRSAIIVSARSDGFVDPAQTEALHHHWPGSELRWVSGGHLSAAVLARRAHRRAIEDAFARLEREG